MNLTEILIAAGISLSVVSTGASLLINETTDQQRIERREQLRADWEKASKFIHGEVKLAERIFDSPEQFTIGSQCGISEANARMAIDARRDLPLIVYGVVDEQAYRQWRLGEELQAPMLRAPMWVRCGPGLTGMVSTPSKSAAT